MLNSLYGFCILVGVALFVTAVFSRPILAGEKPDDDGQWDDSALWKTEDYLILFSTRDYPSAQKFAKQLSNTLKMRLDLRGLSPHQETGLTFSAKDCQESGFSYPCYIARSHEDDEIYISVEHSSSYDFKPGYYIVLAAVGPPKSPIVQQALTRIRPHVPDAYIKQSKVFLGCHH